MITDPQSLDVFVACNLFGDILTDLAARSRAALGMAARANLDPERDVPGLFEPVHGSAPDIAGRGMANPLATVWAAALMLEHLGEADAAAARDAGARDRVTTARARATLAARRRRVRRHRRRGCPHRTTLISAPPATTSRLASTVPRPIASLRRYTSAAKRTAHRTGSRSAARRSRRARDRTRSRAPRTPARGSHLRERRPSIAAESIRSSLAERATTT